MPLDGRREQAPGDERHRSDGDDACARPGEVGMSARHRKVRTDEECDHAGDQEKELDFRDQDAAEHVRLAEFVEPQRVRKDPCCPIGKEQRHPEDNDDDGRPATRTQHEGPQSRLLDGLEREQLFRAKLRRDAVWRCQWCCGGGRDRSRGFLRGSDDVGPSPMTVKSPVLRKEVVDPRTAGNPHVPTSPRPLAPREFALAEERSNRLGTRAERLGCLGDGEIVFVPHGRENTLQLSQGLRKRHHLLS